MTVPPSGNMGSPRPFGIIGLVGFFLFGAAVSLITAIALLDPQGPLEPIWRLKPEARGQFQAMGMWAIPLMGAIFIACSLAALGLRHCRPWGRQLALGILTVNLVGDMANALLRHDWRTLIGLPIGGALIAYLLSARVKSLFQVRP
jgi:hypothetical protein